MHIKIMCNKVHREQKASSIVRMQVLGIVPKMKPVVARVVVQRIHLTRVKKGRKSVMNRREGGVLVIAETLNQDVEVIGGEEALVHLVAS